MDDFEKRRLDYIAPILERRIAYQESRIDDIGSMLAHVECIENKDDALLALSSVDDKLLGVSSQLLSMQGMVFRLYGKEGRKKIEPLYVRLDEYRDELDSIHKRWSSGGTTKLEW